PLSATGRSESRRSFGILRQVACCQRAFWVIDGHTAVPNMSASLRKADIRRWELNVSYVPFPDQVHRSRLLVSAVPPRRLLGRVPFLTAEAWRTKLCRHKVDEHAHLWGQMTGLRICEPDRLNIWFEPVQD